MIKNSVPTDIIVFPVRNEIMFPGTQVSFHAARSRSLNAIREAYDKKQLILVVGQAKSLEVLNQDPKEEEIYKIGTVCQILKIDEDGPNRLLVHLQGLYRYEVINFQVDSALNILKAQGVEKTDHYRDPETQRKQLLTILQETIRAHSAVFQNPEVIKKLTDAFDQVLMNDLLFTNVVAASFVNNPEEKQLLLSMNYVEERAEKLIEIIKRETEANKIKKNLMLKTKEELDKNNKNFFLREQLKQIKKELGEEDSDNSINEDYDKRIKMAKMPSDTKKIAEDESKRLSQLHPTSSEYHVVKNYLEWLLSMPWAKNTKDQLDISVAKSVLSQDHYGMDSIKKRILEFLAVAKLKNTLKGSIICLVGPPGVGKTSLGRSIAKAVNRKFARISLGGVRDESEIRGHRRTYVGAMPGKLIQTMKKIGVNNPVILLDEIDKLARSNQGDPGAALLEVLDPEQNVAFQDHYLDTPFDLSNTLFIATANSLEDIPAPLRDRMEIIMLGSYTLNEKRHIAINHLIPKQLQDHALTSSQVEFSEEVAELVISGYTKEAGVRELQRKIAALCRSAAQEIIENNNKIKITPEKVEEYLGSVIFKHEEKLTEDEVAVATGLAWTPFGGDVLFIEANKSEGSGKITLTGSLGEVMKESAQIAVSYLRSNKDKYKLSTNFDTLDLHIHLPSGAVPKDGPSAGITLATTILSLLTDKKISKNIAMTGELSLRGRVMPVGGIKEKLVAAYKAGILEILLPKENESNLKELPEEVRKGLKIHLVDNIDQVFNRVLNN